MFLAPEDYCGTQSTVIFTPQKRGARQSVMPSLRDRSVVWSDGLCHEIGLGQMELCIRPKSELAAFIVQWTHGNACVETDVAESLVVGALGHVGGRGWAQRWRLSGRWSGARRRWKGRCCLRLVTWARGFRRRRTSLQR